MHKLTTLAALTALAIGFAMPAFAQSAGSANTTVATKLMPATRLVGMSVVNDKGEVIGSVSEIVISTTGSEPGALVSIGNYIGVNERVINVPMSHLQPDGSGRLLMYGATRETLEAISPWRWGQG